MHVYIAIVDRIPSRVSGRRFGRTPMDQGFLRFVSSDSRCLWVIRLLSFVNRSQEMGFEIILSRRVHRDPEPGVFRIMISSLPVHQPRRASRGTRLHLFRGALCDQPGIDAHVPIHHLIGGKIAPR